MPQAELSDERGPAIAVNRDSREKRPTQGKGERCLMQSFPMRGDLQSRSIGMKRIRNSEFPPPSLSSRTCERRGPERQAPKEEGQKGREMERRGGREKEEAGDRQRRRVGAPGSQGLLCKTQKRHEQEMEDERWERKRRRGPAHAGRRPRAFRELVKDLRERAGPGLAGRELTEQRLANEELAKSLPQMRAP